MSVDGINKKKTIGRVDAHQHFWHYHPQRHQWIGDDMASIRKDFLPADLQPLLKQNSIEGCIAVQADQTEAETAFLLELAAANNFISGVVGWIDLQAADIVARLERYASSTSLKGFRHVLQGEAPAFMLQPAFVKGIAQLRSFNFTYDILVYPRHLAAVLQMVQQFPDQPFVIDHLAKPSIKSGILDNWEKDMQAIARCPNVCCKISGMVTESDMRNWKPQDFTPYLDAITGMFGTDRLLYGSDWPVCLAAGSYSAVLSIVTDYYSSFSQDEQQAVFGGNAAAFYNLT